jgi:hypothetical protein
MKAARFIVVVTLGLVSFPIGAAYGLVVQLLRWASYLLQCHIPKLRGELYLLGVRMSSVLNATSATWLKVWLLIPTSKLTFGRYTPVSAMIGHAHRLKHLSKAGRWVRKQLEILDPGHCERAAQKHEL